MAISVGKDYKVVAFIPARSGSTRVIDKNIRLLCGKPLLSYSIESAIKSGVFAKTFVLTDSEKYAEIARKFGAEIPYIRDRRNSETFSPDMQWISEAFENLCPGTLSFDAFAILRPTSPFRTAKTIQRAYEKFIKSAGADSLRAVEKVKQHPGKMWVAKRKIMLPLLPFSNNGVPWHSNQTQVLPEVYIQNASLEICWSKSFIETGSISGETVVPFFTEGIEGFDINTEADFIEAEKLMRARDEF